MRVKAGNEPAGDRPGAGEIKVRSCYTVSSVKSSKDLFWFRRETDKSVLLKLHGKKKK